MDGRFVPHTTIRPFVIVALQLVTDLPMNIRLMIVGPEQCVPDFIKADTGIISEHCEQTATTHLHRIAKTVRISPIFNTNDNCLILTRVACMERGPIT